MKKILAVLTVGAIVASTSASINFKWKGVDGDATAADTVITSVGGGLLGIITVDNKVDIGDLQGLTWLSAQPVQVVPAFLGGGVDTPSLTLFTPEYAGLAAQGIIVAGGAAYTSIADVQVGDTFDITASSTFADAGVTPGIPEELALNPQGTTVTVIPEPATLGLMGVAGLGMFLARRKARR